MQYSPPPRHFIPFRSKYFLRALFSNTHIVCSVLNLDQFSQPWERAVNVAVLNVLERRREDKKLRTAW